MKKNKLYTVNKWNKPAFGNMFAIGGFTLNDDYNKGANFGGIGFPDTPVSYNAPFVSTSPNLDTADLKPLADAPQPKAKSNIGGALMGGIGAVGATLGGVAGDAIRGGFDDGGVGSSIQNIGGQIGSLIPGPVGGFISFGSGVVGGLFSRMFGVKENKENTNFIKQNTQNAINSGNTLAASSDNASLVSNAGKMIGSSGFNWEDLYQNGWFTSKGTRLGNNLIAKENTGLNIQSHGLATGAENIDSNMDRNALKNFAAFGGPLGYFGTGALGIMQNDKYLYAINNRSDAIAKSSPFNASYNGLAFGGELGTNGTDFTNGLLYVDEGGSHESNPLGGVPMGVDEQGIPNFVEEDETVFNDYVFSNRMKVPKAFYNELGLGGALNRKGITFAEASKKLSKESEQRPNDPLSQDGLEDSMARLAAIQEAERMKKNMKEYVGLNGYAYGGNLYESGGALGWLNSNGHKNAYSKQVAEAMENYVKKYMSNSKAKDSIKYKEAYDYIKKGGGNFRNPTANDSDERIEKHYNELINLGMNPRLAFGMAYPKVDERLNEPNKPWSDAPRYKKEQERRNKMYGKLVGTNKSNEKAQETDQETALPGTTLKEVTVTAKRPVGETKETSSNAKPIKGNAKAKVSTSTTVSTPAIEESYNPIPFGGEYVQQPSANPLMDYLNTTAETSHEAIKNYNGDLAAYTETPTIVTPEPNNYVVDSNRAQETPQPVISEEEYRRYPTWMRYAPIVGSGIMSLSDVLGLTNNPDYTEAEKVEDAANLASIAPVASYAPIGDYIKYNPMDIWYEQNRLDANTRATDRALANSSNPARMAGILANNYNSQLASGDLYRKALEYNDAKRQQVADFNRRTNMFNTQMGLEAAMANSRAQTQANSTRLSGLAQAAAMKDAIDARVSAARSANLTNFFENLGNLGRENFIFNQINSDKSRRYKTDRSGNASYSGACGGKLRKK